MEKQNDCLGSDTMKEQDVVVITGKLVVRPGTEEEFIEKVKAYERSCRDHKGLLMHSIMQSFDEPNVFNYHEYWDSLENQRKHAEESPEKLAWVPIRDCYITERKIERWHILQRIVTERIHEIEWVEN